MGRELRTPLNGVLGFAELLAETPLDEEQKDCARTISISGKGRMQLLLRSGKPDGAGAPSSGH
jgi:signal transduction histidine kinase